MRFLTGLIAFAGVAFAAVLKNDGTPPTLQGAYLVELSQDVKDFDSHLHTYFAGHGIPSESVTIRREIRSDVFNGVSFDVRGSHDPTLVQSIPGAKNVWPVTLVSRPSSTVVVDESGTTNEGLQRRGATEPIHSLTGVNDARSLLSLTGRNVKVAVIDTGVYYLHPALGGGYGVGFRVANGFDFVGDDYGVNYTASPSLDPFENCSDDAHGTHVAGVIAADASFLTSGAYAPASSLTGVAPDATIYAYRVFGCQGDTTSDIIIAAMAQAKTDGASIITMPVVTLLAEMPGTEGTASDPISLMASKLASQGVVIVAPAGDDGAKGLFSVESPASASGVLAVASFDNIAYTQQTVVIDGVSYAYTPGAPSFTSGTSFPIVFNDPSILPYGRGAESDACETINVPCQGAILLIGYNPYADQCSVSTRCSNAKASGAVGCILYSIAPNVSVKAETVHTIPSASISFDAASQILSTINAGSSATFTDPTSNYNPATAASVSTFSSLGLALDLQIKPTLGAIGGGVLSTISPYAQAKMGLATPYGVLQGTAIAAAYASGCVALYVQNLILKNQTIDTKKIITAFANNAVPKARFGNGYFSGENNTILDSVASQGAGLINVINAIGSTTLVSPALLSLGDFNSANDVRYAIQGYNGLPPVYKVLNLTNTGKEPVTYFITSTPALTTLLTSQTDFVQLPVQYYPSVGASVMFGKVGKGLIPKPWYNITVAPRLTAKIPVTVYHPQDIDSSVYPIYSGYINIEASNQASVINVPYAGMAGYWSNSPIFSVKADGPYKTGLYNSDGYVGKEGAVVNGNMFAQIVKLLTNPTKYYSVEVVYSGSKTDATVQKLTALNLDYTKPLGYAYVTFPNGVTKGEVGGPLGRSPDSSSPIVSAWSGQITKSKLPADQTPIQLPAGTYQLKFTGQKNSRSGDAPGRDYQYIFTPKFKLLYL
ncbi:hypothetical protein HDU76_000980 [Blyttiomyces sp. JEL0837]|nr:hypothetical protein HDU76_000980 [Blyttiomyces sp. JEL0837]